MVNNVIFISNSSIQPSTYEIDTINRLSTTDTDSNKILKLILDLTYNRGLEHNYISIRCLKYVYHQ